MIMCCCSSKSYLNVDVDVDLDGCCVVLYCGYNSTVGKPLSSQYASK